MLAVLVFTPVFEVAFELAFEFAFEFAFELEPPRAWLALCNALLKLLPPDVSALDDGASDEPVRAETTELAAARMIGNMTFSFGCQSCDD